MIDVNLPMDTLLVWILVGLVAGFLASHIALGHGLGLLGDIVVGIIGAFVGGWLLPKLGVHMGGLTPIVATIASATIGAVVLLLLLRLIRRA